MLACTPKGSQEARLLALSSGVFFGRSPKSDFARTGDDLYERLLGLLRLHLLNDVALLGLQLHFCIGGDAGLGGLAGVGIRRDFLCAYNDLVKLALREVIGGLHGEKLVFGENNEFGLVQQSFGLKVVEIGKDGYTIDDVLVHDAHCEDNTLQLKLALMGNGDGFPIALGVIRDVDAPTYDEAVAQQIQEVSAQKKYHNFAELLETNDTWEVK